MDRRSFIMTLVGGFAAAGLGGIAVAEAAQPPAKPAPLPDAPKADGEMDAELKEGLDQQDSAFSQYYYYRRRPRYWRRPRYYYRPRAYYRPRYYYRRPRYYRRRYW